MFCHTDEDKMQLLMDTLVVIGDLTASESFSERTFFVDFDLFTSLRTILNSPALGKVSQMLLPPTPADRTDKDSNESSKINIMAFEQRGLEQLSKSKFYETIVWTVTNALADDSDCQATFISQHGDLLDDFFQLTQVESDKLKLELCYLVDNLMASTNIKAYLFAQCPDLNSSFKESDAGE